MQRAHGRALKHFQALARDLLEDPLGSVNDLERFANALRMNRDRSSDLACPGCLRITAGVVEHTRTCLAALEEVLCAAES